MNSHIPLPCFLTQSNNWKPRAQWLTILLRFRLWIIAITGVAALPIYSHSAYPQQTTEKYYITGTVTDFSNGKPLYYANVFLSNTTLGAATDSAGTFIIQNIPPGTYTLVVTMMGYKKQTIQIQVPGQTNIYHFRLYSKVLETPEIRITADRLRHWKRNLKEFEHFFLGTSSNASKCKITNPEVLDFLYNETTQALTATTQQPLIIENQALGFRIHFFLEDFFAQASGRLRYMGQSRFEPLTPENKKKEKKWKKNRLKTYKGSFRHFLASLAMDQLEKEEYQIYNFTGKSRSPSIEEIQPESVLSPGITPHNRKLAFSNYLVVIYHGEKEEPQYIKRKISTGSTYYGARRYEQRPPVTMEERRPYQTSFLKINAGDTIYFNIFGHMHNPYAVTYEGYWGWSERIAEWLPMDYTPEHMAKYAYGSYLSPKPAPIALLHKARSDALENNVSEATKSLYNGLKNLGNHPYADSLFTEIWDIISADELIAYSKTADKGEFLLEFWQKTDVTPATQENERYVEHIQRLEYARQYYSSPQPRGYDDRGMIHVRYGPPDDWVKIPSHQFIRSNESWVYWIGSGLTFDFLESGGMYCLVSYLTEENISMVHTDPNTKPVGLIAFLEPRQSLHQKYARFYIALSIPESSIDYGSSDYLAETMREHGNIPHSLTQLAREGESIPLHMAHARFYRKDFTRLEIYYGFPCDLMADDTTSQKRPFVPLIVAIALRDSSYRLLSQETIRKSPRRIAGSLYKVPYYAGQINKTLAPGNYVVNLEFQDPATQKTTEKEMVIKIPGRSPNDLLLSDIQLATTIDSLPEIVTDPSFMKGDLWIIPHPFSFLSAVQPITLYFEIGNLLIDSSGLTSYSVTYTVNRERSGFTEKINPLWKKKTSLSSTYNRTGESRNEQEYFVLDMNTLNPGTYKLTVKVTDNTANMSQSSMKYFTLINQE